MIDLVKKFDSKEKKITEHVMNNIGLYDNSDCKARLENRYKRLKESNDMMFGGPNAKKASFKSKLSFPIVKQRSIIRNSILAQNFRGDPLFTVLKMGGTSAENAKNVQDLLKHNMQVTKFREKAFRIVRTSAAKYGSAVSYSAYRHSRKMGWQTVETELGYDRVKGIIDESMTIMNYPIHILNYIQNPDIFDPEESTYRGHREKITVAELIARIKDNPDVYIKENVDKILKDAKKSGISGNMHYDKQPQWNKNYITLICLYDKCQIEGNEDQDSHYYMEIVEGKNKIIRFQENPHDNDLVPYQIYNYYPKDEYWWGNADSEFALPHENFINMIMGMKADNAMNALQQYIFYGKGIIDKADWDNRFVSGGMIGVDLKDNVDIQRLLFPYQFPDNSIQTTDSIVREVNENLQQINSRPNFYRPGAKTGMLQNTTATGAQMMEEQSDVVEADILETFETGLKELARHNITIAQQMFPDAFSISPEPNESDHILEKKEIFGNFNFRINTSLTKNRTAELQRVQNFLTGLMNFRGTQDPSWMRVNLEPLVRYFVEQGTNDMVEIDDVYPIQPQAAPGFVPSAQQMGPQVQGAAQPMGVPYG